MSFGWSADENSGLEIASMCPDCGRPHGLAHTEATFGYDECHRCRGAFVTGEDARHLFYEVLQLEPSMLAELVHRGQPTDRFCIDCGQSTALVRLRGARAEVCTSCRGTWIPKGGLHRLTGGRFGSVAPKSEASLPRAIRQETVTMPKAASYPMPSSPAQRTPVAPVHRRRRWPVALLVIMIWAGIMVGTALFFLDGDLTKLTALADNTTDAPSEDALPPPAGIPLPEDLPPPTAAVESYIFGGRTLAWWTARLNELGQQSDETAQQRYALTKVRAEANGLLIEGEPGQHKVRPTAALMDRIGMRLEKP